MTEGPDIRPSVAAAAICCRSVKGEFSASLDIETNLRDQSDRPLVIVVLVDIKDETKPSQANYWTDLGLALGGIEEIASCLGCRAILYNTDPVWASPELALR